MTTQRASEMVQRVRPSVVRIEADSGTGTSIGTGVIFKSESGIGYIVTNYHVIAGSSSIKVTVDDSDQYIGDLLGVDPIHDMAVLRVCWGNFQAVPFGDSSDIRVLDEVVNIGYALGLEGHASVSTGKINAVRWDEQYRDVIQTDANINRGNSGGPMLSVSGEILGINTYGIEKSGGRPVQGINFAISEMVVQRSIAKIFGVHNVIPSPSAPSSFGPTSGSLRAIEKSVTTGWAAGVSIADAVIESTFVNPEVGDDNHWDYGIVLRYRRGSSPSFVRIGVSDDRSWEITLRKVGSGQNEQIGKGTIVHAFNTNPGGRNHLRVVTIGERGWLFINGELITAFDISEAPKFGSTAVIFGWYNRNRLDRSIVRVQDFKVTGFNKQLDSVGGELDKKSGIMSVHNSTIQCQNFAMEARFANSWDGNDRWSYGFIIRNDDVVQVDFDGEWIHSTHDVGDGNSVKVQSDYLSDATFQDMNHLLIIVIEDEGWFFVNDQLITKLDLRHNQNYGSASVMATSYEDEDEDDDQGVAQAFSDFSVWAP